MGLVEVHPEEAAPARVGSPPLAGRCYDDISGALADPRAGARRRQPVVVHLEAASQSEALVQGERRDEGGGGEPRLPGSLVANVGTEASSLKPTLSRTPCS